MLNSYSIKSSPRTDHLRRAPFCMETTQCMLGLCLEPKGGQKQYIVESICAYNAHVCDLNAVDTPHDRACHGMGDTILQRVTVGLPLSFGLKLK